MSRNVSRSGMNPPRGILCLRACGTANLGPSPSPARTTGYGLSRFLPIYHEEIARIICTANAFESFDSSLEHNHQNRPPISH